MPPSKYSHRERGKKRWLEPIHHSVGIVVRAETAGPLYHLSYKTIPKSAAGARLDEINR